MIWFNPRYEIINVAKSDNHEVLLSQLNKRYADEVNAFFLCLVKLQK